MHRALLLPEIVATILQTGKSTPGLLFNSLFFNKLFFREASRILWYGCGADWNSAAGHVTPDIRHLARIVQQDVQRAQIYANLIHVLQFRDEGEETNFKGEARWHPQLAQVQFPNLEQLDLFYSENAGCRNTGDVVLHYAQSNMKRLSLHEGSNLSDAFLDTLSRQCPKLRWLILRPITDSEVTEDGLVRFLEKTTSLEWLDIRRDFKHVWTQEAFEAISTYQNLALLVILEVKDAWITALNRIKTVSVFPKMTYLYTSVSDSGLEELHHFMPNLQVLTLHNSELPPSHHILSAASKFTLLKKLKIQLAEDSSITGQELVQLAENCPGLKELYIAEDQAPTIPSATDITNPLIDTFARNLPALQELYLIFKAPDPLTFASLRSLGRHCPDLALLTLSCNVAWDEVQDMSPEVVFPKLWYLKLHPNGNQLDLGLEAEEAIQGVAKKIAAIVPKIMDFGFEDATEMEDLLEDAMTDICYASSPAG